ncbi:motility associated factor glycosyltransferase family protein [Litchfieldia salsa]|uniref:Uncharacterized conserved protein n=1 Tax=Litchfieldia salsa TaxID=930152 RepID=A0A1H0WDR1_9BACI|nr:6-hydroxymethylpterin diphosphokinase MptE-like protein [Litchfieldia salsa]SDP88834.1 Uncharacterized conserved protein [Litchfieldia salsa]
MIKTENMNYLLSNHPQLYKKIIKWEKQNTEVKSVVVEKTKNNCLTLKIMVDGNSRYIHSKYDPLKEADRLINQLSNLDQYNHVLFIGVGLGYHITELIDKYPNMYFSIYEPNIEVLYEFLSTCSLHNWPLVKLQSLFTGTDEEELQASVHIMQQKEKKNTFVFTLPPYVNMYSREELLIIETVKEVLTNKKISIMTNLTYQERWTLNSIKNFPYLLRTPNILMDTDKGKFKGKPALMVAAGPSLAEEIEYIKHIKDNKLAYVFSVGSAINALLEHGIEPDGTFTYDPTAINQKVISKLKKTSKGNIPLVFGSTVGFETLADYQGIMLHMITSQDTMAPLYLDKTRDIDIVWDAPSIAVITFQVLQTLGFSKIILVGQNLSYLNNKLYSEGISYDFLNSELSEEQKKTLIPTKDVYGNTVMTHLEFNIMRNQLELYIDMNNDIKVINTTKGGAHIEGTLFMPLSNVIQEELTDPVVDSEWHRVKNGYDLQFVYKRYCKIETSKMKFEQLFKTVVEQLKEIDKSVKTKQLKKLETKFVKFDGLFQKMKKNEFYQGFIEPMNRVHNERLSDNSKDIRYETDLIKKGTLVVTAFEKFLYECEISYQFVLPYYEELSQELTKLFETQNQEEQ